MRQKLALLNSSMNVFNYVITFLFNFFIRKLLIKFLGIEILGINSVIVDTISILSLCELGIQTAIICRLYKVIASKDTKKENEIYVVFSNAYKLIGTIIFGVGLILIPFLSNIVNTELDYSFVIILFLLQLGASVLSYFVSCPRLLYLAHQKLYLCTKWDILFQIFVFLAQIFSVVILKNYFIYILCTYIKIIGTNLIIRKYFHQDFSYIDIKLKPKINEFKDIFADLKDIVAGNIACCIYNSTDNIVMSIIFGASTVGYISNYKVITNAIRSIMDSISNAMAPMCGNYLNEGVSNEKVDELIKMYIFFQFGVCSVLLVPTACLSEEFIELWLGNNFVLGSRILYLIIAEIFIYGLHQGYCMILRSYGMFSEDKMINIVAVILNLVSSVILARLIGVEGVLTGTVITLFWYWGGRSYIAIRKIFGNDIKEFLKAYYMLFKYIFMFFTEIFMAGKIAGFIKVNNNILQFLCRGFIIEIFIVVFFIMVFSRSKVMKNIIEKAVKPLLSDKKG